MKILMLRPYPQIKGPFPKIIPLLINALQQEGCHVAEAMWGRLNDNETAAGKVINRLKDIYKIRTILKRNHYDIMFIHNGGHDLKTIWRDLPLLIATRRFYRQAVLQIHGANLRFVQEKRHWGHKTLTHFLFSFLGGVILSSTQEIEIFNKFSKKSRFFVADNVYQRKPNINRPKIPKQWNLPNDRPVIFFAARLIPEKGIQELLAAMPLVLEKVDCHFLVAGDGPLETQVKDCLSEPPVQGHATWVGYLDWEQLELAYSLASIFVLPTYYFEGFPAVIQDALGHALPIVTTPVRGMADHLVDGVHARLIPPKDSGALANALVELLQDHSLRENMSVANRKKVLDFAPEIVGRQYTDILKEILNFGAQS
jgi:glycosyltransferase involved in cell wall biosynthesis